MVWLHGVTNICQFKVWDRVVNSWTVDLDADGKPEAVVISESDGSGCYGEVKVVTLEGSRLIAVSLPNLSEEMTHEYEGHDEFRMDGNRRIVRIYPVGFRDAKLRSSKIGRRIVYEFKNMRLVTIESRLIPGLCPYWGDSTTFDDKKAPSSPFSAVSACCVL
jgi:predicted GNAT superfamily acetyltransferase